MRLALIGITAIVTLAAGAQPSSAQFNARYCMFGGRGSGEPDCSYNTMAQCRAAASGLGRYCGENPNYRGQRRGYSGTRQPSGYSGNWTYRE